MPADSDRSEALSGMGVRVAGRGRSLAGPAFPDDDGSPDEELRRVLAQWPVHGPVHGPFLERLARARLLVAVVAVVDELAIDGSDKCSHMAVVSMVNAAGERGLLAFTGLDALQRWDPTARPVPVRGVDAARSAIEDGADALVIDVLGPRRHVLVRQDVQRLAALDDGP